MSTQVIYKDIAPDVEQYTTVTADESFDDSKPQELLIGLPNGKPIALEHNFWVLDGNHTLYDPSTVAVWSDALSNEQGYFADTPSVTFDISEQFTTKGVTITFDTANNEWCDIINVKWYQGEILKVEKRFYPDAVIYFVDQTVESFDKIVVEFIRTNHPYRRARMEQFMFGIIRTFGMDEVRSAQLIHDCNLISLELPSAEFDWDLDSLSDVDYLFQLKQPIEVMHDGNLIGTYYVKESSRKSSKLYSIECQDIIGVLDGQTFEGGAYLSGTSAKGLVSSILGNSFEPIYEDVEDTTLYGVIAEGTKRDALQQIFFAWGVMCTTDNTNKIRIKYPPTNVKQISDDDVFLGQTVDYSTLVTSVRLKYHSYVANNNQSGVKIGNNYYTDTETTIEKVNPNVTANNVENIIEVSEGTLVDSHNAQAVLDRLYDYYLKRSSVNTKIVLNGEMLGDMVGLHTEWDTEAQGNIVTMKITLSNTIVADIETLGNEVSE